MQIEMKANLNDNNAKQCKNKSINARSNLSKQDLIYERKYEI